LVATNGYPVFICGLKVRCALDTEGSGASLIAEISPAGTEGGVAAK
jgi:hypothetical protein